jgi:hypothetical protein
MFAGGPLRVDRDSFIDDLTAKLDEANQAGVTDKQLAYALMAINAGFPFDDALAPHGDLIWKLAWLLNVRAPGLDLRWLVKSALALDKVYWGVLPLRSLLDKVWELEQSAAVAFGDVNSWLSAGHEDENIGHIRAVAAQDAQITTASGEQLKERVNDAMAEVRDCVKTSDLLTLAIDSPHRV